MKQKEEELLTEKVRKTKTAEQINTLAAIAISVAATRAAARLVAAQSFGRPAVDYWRPEHIARKQEKQLIERSESHIEHVAPITPEPKRPSKRRAAAADSVKIQISKESDPRLA